MVKDDLYITVPSYFRCPISLDVMKSPVSLCTGVTYDRSSIQRWLDGGNNTCPATMQVLHSKELIPNYTLQRLIKIWSDSVLTRQPNWPPPPPDSLTSDQARELISQLESDLQKHSLFQSSVIVTNLSRLVLFAGGAEENGRFLGAAGGRILPLLVGYMGKVKDLGFLEKIVLFCNVLMKNLAKDDAEEQSNALKSMIGTGNCDLKSAIMMGLKQGKLELRIAVARFLELMAARLCLELHSSPISEDDEIYSELLRLITTSDLNPDAMDASLSFLTRLVVLKRNRVKMIRAGGVKVLAATLSQAELSAPLSEKVLKLLEMSSGCKEGRNEICTNETCVRAIVKKVLKVSNAATEHAVTVLWSLCCLFGDKRAAAALAESNGMAKILLLLQSNCSPAVRQMCRDLLRVFRCSSKNSCVSWYDTKTTHIMPF
ncbi:U-box domain-containing protein 27 [Sesamum alatum]|uniref:U-box domain-containing protein n=1 Tax=Sesamum alatum TaxID=300844 RepID=A0AAE2CC48_9LAMI|nr:U-box domain-containing protein 27 [Sesamum alatum]